MADFDITSDANWSTWITGAGSGYDDTADTIYISEGSKLIIDADASIYIARTGDNSSGTATDKYGIITDDGSAHTLTIKNKLIPESVGGSDNLIDLEEQTINFSGAHSFIDGYNSGSIDCSLRLVNNTISGGTSWAVFMMWTSQTITGDWLIHNNTISTKLFYARTSWTQQGNMTITDNTIGTFADPQCSPTLHADCVWAMTGNDISGNTYMHGMIIPDTDNVIMNNNSFGNFIRLNNSYDWTTNPGTVTAASWDGSGDDISISDNNDGTITISLENTVSGSPSPNIELYARIGSSPAYSDTYFLGEFDSSLFPKTIYTDGTGTEFSNEDDVYVQARVINSAGSENASNSPTVTIETSAATWNGTGDDISLIDNSDGTITMFLHNDTSGSGVVDIEVYVRIGESPSYSNRYLYAKKRYNFFDDESLKISCEGGGGLKFSPGDEIYVQAKAVNTYGGEEASNSPSVEIGGIPLVDYPIYPDKSPSELTEEERWQVLFEMDKASDVVSEDLKTEDIIRGGSVVDTRVLIRKKTSDTVGWTVYENITYTYPTTHDAYKAVQRIHKSLQNDNFGS